MYKFIIISYYDFFHQMEFHGCKSKVLTLYNIHSGTSTVPFTLAVWSDVSVISEKICTFYKKKYLWGFARSIHGQYAIYFTLGY